MKLADNGTKLGHLLLQLSRDAKISALHKTYLVELLNKLEIPLMHPKI